MIPHPVFTLLASALLSAATAMVEGRSPREQRYVAARVFFCCTATSLGAGWLMYFIHG